MTTNAGSAELAKPAIGFERHERLGEDTEAIEKIFTPEFRNRLDSIITFGALPPKIVALVVEKFVMELELQLEDRGVQIELSETDYDPISATTSNSTRVTADIDTQAITLSLGKSF